MMLRKILIIEDDEDQAASLMKLLRREGEGSVVCCHSPTFADGKRRAALEDYDCIILDLGLPDEDLLDAYAVAARIPELGSSVIAWTGSGDPELFAAVRKSGASIVTKPGTNLLIEKVWAAINRRTPDRESEMAQLQAQRVLSGESERVEEDFAKKHGPLILLIIALVTTSCGFGAWAWNTISSQAKRSEQVDQEIRLINKRLDADEARAADGASRLKIHDQQNQVSIDDRAAIHLQLQSMYDTQHELKLDVIRRLERIEDSVLTLIKKENRP